MIIEDIFILPMGSYEYHGAEMSADTDSIIVQYNHFNKLSDIPF